MPLKPKRTFIPPENRPVIRGAELRSAMDSRHYLAIFNHPARRKIFIAEQTQQPSFETQTVFGISAHQWQELVNDLRGGL